MVQGQQDSPLSIFCILPQKGAHVHRCAFGESMWQKFACFKNSQVEKSANSLTMGIHVNKGANIASFLLPCNVHKQAVLNIGQSDLEV